MDYDIVVFAVVLVIDDVAVVAILQYSNAHYEHSNFLILIYPVATIGVPHVHL